MGLAGVHAQIRNRGPLGPACFYAFISSKRQFSCDFRVLKPRSTRKVQLLFMLVNNVLFLGIRGAQ